jgi:RNA 3'-terminal phosphate cyclase (ATP)
VRPPLRPHTAEALRSRLTYPVGESPLWFDGSYGEGGGQLLRTALALAVALARPIRLQGIRARRRKPGLQPQHHTVVRALAAISDAVVEGDEIGSTAVSFTPRGLRGGEYRFDVGAERGSAGSVALLFQSLLLPLSLAGVSSRLTLIGGTHVPWSPTVHYIRRVFLPALRGTGMDASIELVRWGWYPAGGGEIAATITPTPALDGFTAPPSAPIEGLSAVSRLPRSIAERQRRRALERLAAAGLDPAIEIEEDGTALGPGTMVFLASPARAGFAAFGRRGLLAERVADEAADQLLAWLRSRAEVDDHLADQLVPFLALASRPSTFTCPTVSTHLRTVAWVVRQFLPVRIELHEGTPARVEIVPAPPAS